MAHICRVTLFECNSIHQKENLKTFFPSDKVPESDRGEGDDNKVDGLQSAPALNVLEDDDWQRHEDEAPEQDEDQSGDNADLRLADLPLLVGKRGIADTKNR